MSAADIAAKLPKGKVAIINCSTGGRAMEARTKLKDAKFDVSKVLYFDANIKCDNANKCDIKVNVALGEDLFTFYMLQYSQGKFLCEFIL